MNTKFIGKQNKLLAKIIINKTIKDRKFLTKFGKVDKEFQKTYDLGVSYFYAFGAHVISLLSLAKYIPSWLPISKKMLRFIPLRFRKRVMIASAFCVVIDEVLDSDRSKNRIKNIYEIMYGNKKVKGTKEVLRNLTQEIIKRGANPEFCDKWITTEQKAFNNEKDPEGICFRRGGCESASYLLNWAIKGSKEDYEKLLPLAFLSQMIDDVIDKKEDEKLNIKTPATEGIWSMKTVEDNFEQAKNNLLKNIKNKKLYALIDENINWFFYNLITEMKKEQKSKF